MLILHSFFFCVLGPCWSDVRLVCSANSAVRRGLPPASRTFHRARPHRSGCSRSQGTAGRAEVFRGLSTLLQGHSSLEDSPSLEWWARSRHCPVLSRKFKSLSWLTGSYVLINNYSKERSTISVTFVCWLIKVSQIHNSPGSSRKNVFIGRTWQLFPYQKQIRTHHAVLSRTKDFSLCSHERL